MNILFLGGDLRQEYASKYVQSNGHNSCAYIDFTLDKEVVNKIENAQIIVLPLPLSIDDIHVNINNRNSSTKIIDILSCINQNQLLIAGKISPNVLQTINTYKIKVIDYNNIEYFQIFNAFLSAEGGIYYTKTKHQKSFYNSSILILGFGRIGKILSYLLHLQGAHITIGVRNEKDIAWAKLCGFKTIDLTNKITLYNSFAKILIQLH